jgi:hypothetical protein
MRSANRIASGKPGTEHVLIIMIVRDGSACEILRALGADPHTMRFETKKLAWPSSPAGGPRVSHVGGVAHKRSPSLSSAGKRLAVAWIETQQLGSGVDEAVLLAPRGAVRFSP